MCTRMQERQ